MANRYELSDEGRGVEFDLFIEIHGRRRRRLSDRLMLDGVLWLLARFSGALRPIFVTSATPSH